MRIYRYILLSIISYLIMACGMKSDVVPKSSLYIPLPTNIDYAINSDGVSIYNGSDNYTLFVEKADESIGFFNLASFKRVALINPKQTFLDTEVINNRVYKYRFRHYYGRVATYSPALIKTIKYYSPIKHSKINITYEKDRMICVHPGISDVISKTIITINGTNFGEAKNGAKTCFDNPDDTRALLSVTAMPYDKNNNAGIPYRKSFMQNIEKLNLPPQNITIRRKDKYIVITWDKAENDTKYNIYLTENDKDKFISQIDIELFRYTAKDDNCVDLKLASVRNRKESKKISVSACK